MARFLRTQTTYQIINTSRNYDYLYFPLTQTLSDNWASGTINTSKWQNWSSGQASVVSQQLNITTTLSATYYGVDSLATTVTFYDFRNSYVQNQLINAGNQSLASFECYPIYIYLAHKTNTQVHWRVAGGLIIAAHQLSGTTTTLYSTTYSSSTHKYFRIREVSGTTYWDWSTDGVSWTNVYSETDAFNMSAVVHGQQVGTFSTEASTTTGIFDNYNFLGNFYTTSPSDSQLEVDSSTRSITKSDTDTQASSDASTRSTGKTAGDTQGSSDSGTKSASKPLSDTQASSDNSTRSTGKSVSDSQAETDTSTKSIGKNISDSQKETDSSTKSVGKSASDLQAQTDSSSKSTGKSGSDSQSQSDSITKSVGKNASDTQTETDSSTKSIGKVTSDSQKTTDTSSKNTGKSGSDTQGSGDTSIRGIAKTLIDLQSFTETISVLKSKLIPLSDSQITDDTGEMYVPYFQGQGSGGYVSIPGISAYNISNQFTWSCWFIAGVIPDGATQDVCLFGREDNAVTNRILLKIATSGSTLRWNITGSGTSNNTTGSTTIVQGQPTHAVLTYDGANIKLYVNGVLDTSQAFSSSFGFVTANVLAIGNEVNNGSPASRVWHGNIWNTRFYSVGMTQFDVTNLYNNTITTQESSLIGSWALGEGSGTTLHDGSSNANNGSFSGAPTPFWVTRERNGAITKSIGKIIADIQSGIDNIIRGISKAPLTESQNSNDTIIKRASKPLFDTQSEIDSLVKGANKVIFDSQGSSDTLVGRMISKTVGEVVNTSDGSPIKSITRSISDIEYSSDAIIRGMARSVADAQLESDLSIRSVGRVITDNQGESDSVTYHNIAGSHITIASDRVKVHPEIIHFITISPRKSHVAMGNVKDLYTSVKREKDIYTSVRSEKEIYTSVNQIKRR